MFQVYSFFIYWLNQVDEHSLQSPFLYDLYTKVIQGVDLSHSDIEEIRGQLLKNKQVIEITDLGAGSRINNGTTRSISSIAKHASTPKRFSQFLTRLIDHFDYKNILELGTSLGLNTLYISKNADVNVLTFEGDKNIADLAHAHFKKLNRTNIKSIVGNIDKTLEKELSQIEKVDLAYIDANHRYEPTLRYFDQISTKIHSQSIIIVDDIHWSKEMVSAWRVLKRKPEVTLSIDLFEAGLLFFDPRLDQEDYILKF